MQWWEWLFTILGLGMILFAQLLAFYLGIKAGRGEALEIKKPKPRVHLSTPEGEAAAYERQQQRDRKDLKSLKERALV